MAPISVFARRREEPGGYTPTRRSELVRETLRCVFIKMAPLENLLARIYEMIPNLGLKTPSPEPISSC